MAKPRFTHRRTVLKTIGAGIIGSTLSAGTTIAGGHTFAQELNTVREATRKYRDVDIAEGDGYGFFGVVPHAGVVYANTSYVGNTGLTDRPALLFYAPSEELDSDATKEEVEETTLVLAGVEWLITPRIEEPERGEVPDMFSDEDAHRELKVTELEGWHAFPDPPGPEEPLDFTGLHAWVHLANPDGVFARDHPIMIERISD